MTEPHDCSRDQQCVNWAHDEVEKVVTLCRELEAERRKKGDEVQAMRYRVAANIMSMRLISGGCVISPFSTHGPAALLAMGAAK